MKRLINRLICLFKGHEWEPLWRPFAVPYGRGLLNERVLTHRCTRCGKFKEKK